MTHASLREVFHALGVEVGGRCAHCGSHIGPKPAAPRFRLLTRGEDIRQGDEVLQSDAATWAPLSGDLLTVTYEPGQFRPVRRKVPA